MNKALLLALAAGAAVAGMSVSAPAAARDGCGPGYHRGPHGHCWANRGHNRLVVHRYYRGQGYWDGRRYWRHRRHDRGRWHYY
jgi:hypothetical protein